MVTAARYLQGATARCQHCPEGIEQVGNGTWVDGKGFATCVKAPLNTVGQGGPAGFVLHTPMPEVGAEPAQEEA